MLRGRFSNNKGFTLFEIVLSVVIIGIIFGVASETMIRQADTYSFITNRKSKISDVRYAINRMAHEVRYLETVDINSISSSSISFVDEDGQSTSFSLAASGSSLAIYRGSSVIIPNVSDFDIEYLDEAGDALAASADQIPNVRRIKLTITTEAEGNEGNITLSTTIIPRAFLGYVNYQE